jgi:hypothetical protein
MFAVSSVLIMVVTVWLPKLRGWKWRIRGLTYIATLVGLVVITILECVHLAPKPDPNASPATIGAIDKLLQKYFRVDLRPAPGPPERVDKPSPIPTPAANPHVDVWLALITKIYKMRDERGAYMKGGQNDVIGVLRVQQHHGVRIRHVRALKINGTAPLPCTAYLSVFGKDGASVESIFDECNQRKPYVRISWSSFPLDQNRIDNEDEQFIRFNISDNLGAFSFPDGDQRRSIGFAVPPSEPELSITSPVWYLLVRFSGTRSDLTGINPTPTDEVKNGSIKLQALLDEETIQIPSAHITCPWTVSLTDSSIKQTLAQELFYGLDPHYGPLKE